MATHQSQGRGGMRICVVGSSKLFFSGITAYTICLANSLARRNQVSVVLLRKLLPRPLFPGREHVGKDQYSVDFAPGIDVYQGMDYNSPRSWLGAYRFLKEHRPNAIIMLWWSSSVAHMQLFLKVANRWGIGARMILEMHEVLDPLEKSILPVRLYSRMAGGLLVRGLDAYTTQSHFDKAEVTNAYHIEEEKISVILHGLYEDYKQPMDRTLAREELGIEEEFVVLHFGLIRQYKGVSYLIEAFNSLPGSVANCSRLMIVGEIWEEREMLRQLVDTSPYSSRITLVPQYVPDAMIPKYFSAADVEILFSSGCGGTALLEGFGERGSPYRYALWQAYHSFRSRPTQGVPERLSRGYVYRTRRFPGNKRQSASDVRGPHLAGPRVLFVSPAHLGRHRRAI